MKNIFPVGNWQEASSVCFGKEVELEDHGRVYTGQKAFAETRATCAVGSAPRRGPISPPD